MDSNPQSVKPMSDDQELAKVLAGVGQQTDQALQFEETPVTPPATPPTDAPVAPSQDPGTDQPEAAETAPAPTHAPSDDSSSQPETTPEEPEPAVELPSPTEPVMPTYNPPVITSVAEPATDGPSDLNSIKKDALNDLRPLVDKLEIAPEEKFDTYLLLIRSTDDKTLIAPAYAAAQAIPDEARKAQALLDVIKEIDYLSNPPQ
jgi:hypothetical protein